MSIEKNLSQLGKTIPSGCTLVAVSKTQPVEKIMEAYACGHRIFGENRAQELADKFDRLPRDIEWHMVGHLQTNKLKYIIPFVSLIHSVDRVRLLEEINRHAARANRTIPCLLQVHIAEEDTKTGFSQDEIADMVTSLSWEDFTSIQVKGLMGMATFTDNTDQVRREFRMLRSIFEDLRKRALPDQVKMDVLSMGMSGDYQLAIEEGSNMVRVGTAIFGERQTA